MPIATLNAIVIDKLLTKECQAFSNVFVFGVQAETGLFSDLCVFTSVFEELRLYSGAMWKQGKTDILSRFQMKMVLCERDLNV